MDLNGLFLQLGAIIVAVKAVITSVLIVVGSIGAVLKGIEALIQIIAPFTSWKWDDNLATMLGKWAALKIFNKKAE